MMKILVATNNRDKQAEFKKILDKLGLEVVFPSAVGLSGLEVKESGKTFAENAFLKAQTFARQSNFLTLADDSGLKIKALAGAPGVHSKRFFAGNESDRNQRMIELLAGKKNRQAEAVSVLCLYDPKRQQAQYFKGVWKGKLGFKEKGKTGFGFDTIFIPLGKEETVAQLGSEYKNKTSHRALALKKLHIYFKKHLKNKFTMK